MWPFKSKVQKEREAKILRLERDIARLEEFQKLENERNSIFSKQLIKDLTQSLEELNGP